jgi:hypothetical protein
MSFSDAKSMMQERARMKTAMLETYSSCVNGAKDKTALMLCKEDKMEDKKAMKDDIKSRKQSMEEKMDEKIDSKVDEKMDEEE